jgi:phage terminase large subunit GpA-like protein
MLNQSQIEGRLIALGNHDHDGSAAAAFMARLDALLPQAQITTNEFDRTKRVMVNQGGEPFPFDPEITPYMEAIGDALDNEAVRVVLAKANTRSGKTTKGESFVLRRWTYGPLVDVAWLMQDENSLRRYIDERGEKMLQLHDEVNEKIDWTNKRNSRFFKQIGRANVYYLPATLKALRGLAAPIFIADEIDAYANNVRGAIMTIISSRQEEFGTGSKAYLCSHPDKGPDDGIDQALKDSLMHLWFVVCPHCRGASTPAKEAEQWGVPRMTWNVTEMMKLGEEMERIAFLDHVAANVVLCCPHDGCGATFGPDERLALMRSGRWLQPHQTIKPDGTVQGEARVASTMGFVIHAFMAPFVKLRETARDWAAAKLTADANGIDVHLREVTVKKLGETYQGAKAEEQMEDWKTVQQRIASHYPLGFVPTGCLFLTAFVDVQGDRFEVRVVGWDLGKQSWLVDAFAIKQWPAFGKHGAFNNIDPGNRLSDWDIIEEAVLARSYPLQGNAQREEAGLEPLFLPIARTMVDAVGVPGVTGNARNWLANMLTRGPDDGRFIAEYRIKLVHGSSSKTQKEVYGVPKQVLVDDRNRALAQPIFERYPNVHEIKRIIAKRMKVEAPGPGRMHMPASLSPRYYQELTAERLINGDWTPSSTRNETWDGWVMCEVARETLMPDRPELWNQKDAAGNLLLPEWADPRPRGEAIDSVVQQSVSIFDRLAQANDDV